MGSARGAQLDAGFAKLQGKDFQYIMQSYEIIVRCNSKKGKVDFDLSAVGGDRDVSRLHARIFYDFQHRSFSLEVLGQHGCYVQRVLHRPSDDPVKLKSQDLIQMGQTRFYFLLPARPIFASFAAEGTPHSSNFHGQSRPSHSDFSASRNNGYGGANCGNGINVGTGTQGLYVPSLAYFIPAAKKFETRKADKDEDNKLEYHLTSCVAVMISIHCDASRRQWMPVEQLPLLTKKFTAIWPYGNAQKYLAPEDGSSTRTAARPWHRLLELLKNHPERFIMSSISRGTITLEFVSLVSLADKFCSPEVDQVTARFVSKK
ncbi:hypothetical protein VPH35_091121 [Triticum aestivum]